MAPPHTTATNSTDHQSIDALIAAIDPSSRDRCNWLGIPGLTLVDGFRGWLECGARRASVRLDSPEMLSVRLPVSVSQPACALAQNAELPGNVRFAQARDRGHLLLADVPLSAVADVGAAIDEVRRGLDSAARGARPAVSRRDRQEPVDNQQVRAVLDQMAWGRDSIVDQAGGWELRPRLCGSVCAIRLEVSGRSELRLHRVVCCEWPADSAARSAACANQALRLNCQLHLARVAVCGSMVVCEARLSCARLQPRQLDAAARAVAAACRHVEPPLSILAADEQVASAYLNELCDETPAASRDVNRS